MGKPVQLALGLLAFACLGLVSWEQLDNSGPSYRGRRLTNWLEDLDLESTHSPVDASHAIRAIGTNALPVLFKMIRASDPFWKRGLLWLDAKQSILRLRISTASLTRCRAVQGYAVLGPAAKDAVNPLIRLLETEPNIETRSDVAAALGAIGPEARSAIPMLWKAAQSGKADLRKSAIFALMKIQMMDQSVPVRGF